MTRRRWYLVMNALVFAWLVATVVVAALQALVPASGWLMVHLFVLGAVSTAILIWSQHFADTLLRRQAVGGRRWLGIRLGAFTIGAVCVVTGMVAGPWPLLLAGAILAAAVASAHAITLTVQLRGALPSRFGPLVRYYLVAAGALVVGIGMGVLMTGGGLSGELHARLYIVHVGMNLLGWIGLTVVGTVLLLWPTVLHVRASETVDAAGRIALPVMAAGLLVIAAAALLDARPVVALGVAGYLVGVALVLREGIRQARLGPPATFAGWSIGLAAAWFAGCCVAFGALVATAPSWADAAGRLGALVPAFAVGFVAQVLSGALSYLLPVVAGGGPDAARAAAAELDRAAAFRVVVINVGLAVALLPVPGAVGLALAAVILAALASFIALAVRAVVVARRVRAQTVQAGPRRSRMEASARPKHTRSGMVVAAVGVIALTVSVGIAIDPAAAGIPLAGPRPVASTAHTTTVDVTAKDMRFHPGTVTVPAGDRLVINVTNADDTVHDLTLATGATSGYLKSGASGVVDVGVVTTNIGGWCSIPGHRQLGMVFAVKVSRTLAAGTAASPTPNARQDSMPGMDHSTGSGPSAAKGIDLSAKPPAAFVARDATLPPASRGTVHKVTFTVKNIERDVAPGVKQKLWTFGGTAPGPTLHGKVGDTFRVTLINDGTIGHSIDFHAGDVAPNAPMRTIGPGDKLVYTFTAKRSGIWLYHCSTMPMSLHNANGMYGAVVIDPAGLDPVDHEYFMLQSEYYLGPQGDIADAAKVASEQPDLVVFNGYADQYVYRPLQVKAGDRVRIWVLDAGPNVASSFHVIGAQFDTVFEEGDYRLKDGGSTGTGGSQALGLQPAQGGFVELTFPQPGDYSFVSHIMSDAEKGAKGVFHVTG